MTYIREPHMTKNQASDVDLSTHTGAVMVDPSDGSTYQQNTYEHVDHELVDTMTGWNIPDFHRRMRAGELLPHTPWRKLSLEGHASGTYDITLSRGEETDRYYSETFYNPYDGKWRVTEADLESYLPSTSNDMLVQEAASRIYSSGHDTLTFLAELVELRSLFVNTARKLLTLSFPRNWRELSNDWLAGRYGWRVLFYDIMSLNEALRGLNDKRRTRFSEQAGHHYTDSQTSVYQNEFGAYHYERTVHDYVKVSLRGSVTADAEIPAFQFNLLQSGWELIPFSFVIDWFYGIGKAIAAASFLSCQTAFSASSGYRVELTRTFEGRITEGKSTFISGTFDTGGVTEAVLEVRTPCRIPTHPHWRARLNPAKIIDMLALVAQRAFRR